MWLSCVDSEHLLGGMDIHSEGGFEGVSAHSEGCFILVDDHFSVFLC